ncbi:MAG TPA: EamA family transporter, partial [Acidobacteriaceae bacterium]|nr:EamA family transporter [Acidobacteriaceae bacterium]
AMGSFLFFVALKHTTAATVAQYHYTQLLTGALMAYLIWRTQPTVFMILGAVLIVGSGMYIAITAPRSTWPAVPAHGVGSD